MSQFEASRSLRESIIFLIQGFQTVLNLNVSPCDWKGLTRVLGEKDSEIRSELGVSVVMNCSSSVMDLSQLGQRAE